MSGLFCFPFNPRDFSSDGKVEAMTTLEVGAYILILCKAWHEDPVGTVPDDDQILSKWARMAQPEWEMAKPAVMRAFRFVDGRWNQFRMMSEWKKLSHIQAERSASGKLGAERRWGKNDSINTRHGSATRLPMAKHGYPRSYNLEPRTKEEELPFMVSRKPNPDKPDKKKKRISMPEPESKEECIAHCIKMGLKEWDGRALWDHWMGNGFTVRNKPMRDWRYTCSSWAKRGIFFPSLQGTKR
jgi:uncharacterized protein YdaU (DUF1376 family)